MQSPPCWRHVYVMSECFKPHVSRVRAWHVYWDELRNYWQARVQVPSPSPKSNMKGKEEFGLWAVSKISGACLCRLESGPHYFSLLKIYNLNKWLDKLSSQNNLLFYKTSSWQVNLWDGIFIGLKIEIMKFWFRLWLSGNQEKQP